MEVSLKALVDKLDPIVHQALDQAAWLCRSMTHYDVELEHLLLKLVETDSVEIEPVLRHFDVDRSRLVADLTSAAERLKRGNTRDTPGISPRIPELLKSAWLHASVDQGRARISSGNVLFALVADPELIPFARGLSRELARLEPERLAEVLRKVGRASESTENASEEGALPARSGDALDRFTIDLTARARAGKIDPVLGRDAEIRQMVDILLRRRQNNPILTGEPGVGKTAVVEGLALRIAQNDVPEPLRGNELRTLDLGLLQAGAGVRGEFEERLKNVIAEVKQSATPIVLFIDEAHTLIGSGGGEGQSDAANLLKPALARGELRTIAATTWAEYKKYFEKDAALARRFQVVKLDEPDEKTALVMLRGIADKVEEHHRVKITPEALEAAVRFSARYLSDRQLPDKAVSVLDTACARVAVGRGATPAALEDSRRRLEALRTEERLLLREKEVGADSRIQAERLVLLASEIAAEEKRARELEQRWNQEKELVSAILAARGEIEAMTRDGASTAAAAREDVLARLKAAEEDLRQLQGEKPLVTPYVDAGVVASIVGQWTGIPVGRMLADEIQTVLNLQKLLAQRIVGQDHALDAIARRIHTSRARLEDPSRPVGVFLLVGPSGVGKTETALALAELLYGGERNMITINMSEFQEAHTVASLKGSPPGYVGYGEGGVLTEAVRRRPYSVVLLDEVEKAHPDVMELFYQVFDKGALEDGQGRRIDFKNTILLLTSNLASQTIVRHVAEAEQGNGRIDGAQLAKAIHPELTRHFKPALVGRMVVIPYLPLSAEVLRDIAKLKLERLRRRLDEQHRVPFTYDDGALDALLARCTEADTGARNLDHVISGSILPAASRLILSALAAGTPLSPLRVRAGEGGRLAVETG